MIMLSRSTRIRIEEDPDLTIMDIAGVGAVMNLWFAVLDCIRR